MRPQRAGGGVALRAWGALLGEGARNQSLSRPMPTEAGPWRPQGWAYAPVLTKRVACEEEGEEILALEQPRGVEALKEWTHEREPFAQQPTLWGQPGGHSGTA